MALETVFEKTTCGRCGGSGSYSYCQSYGSTCFKCHGKGEVLTKRGAAASAFLLQSLMVPLSDVAVGDVLRVQEIHPAGTISYWAKVSAIEEDAKSHSVLNAQTGEWSEVRGRRVTTHSKKRGDFSIFGNTETQVRRAVDNDTKRAKLSAALAFQSTLTKTGTPRKRALATAEA